MSVDIRPNPASSGAVTGGLVYKGSYNATTNSPDLTSSTKGDFYIVSVGGTLAGITLNVGDHIVFNQDASSPITSAMFDVIDNTDAVASVNGATGVVVLGASDVSALAIANNLSDLNNATTARTNLGLGTAATEDVGTGANNVVQLDGSSRLPAVDGSQLTNLPGGSDTLDDVVGRGATTTTAISTGGLTVSGDIDPSADATHSIGDENTRFISYYGDMNGAIRFKAKNDSGGVLNKGEAVYIKGISGTVPTVDKAQANSSATMNAFGLVFANANDQAEVQIITFGNLNDVNTSTFTAGDTVFISSSSAGALVNTAPTGESNLIQNIGKVLRSDASAGIIKVGGAGRSNATPNLNQDKIFLGNASNQATATAISSIALSGFNNDAFLTIANNLSDLNNASTARTNLGVAIGSDVQAYDAQLADIAGLTPTDSNFIVGNGTNFVTESGATARTSLGLTIGTDVQAYDAQLADIAGLAVTDGNFIVGNGTNFVAESGLTARTSLGCGSAATFEAGSNTANQLVQLDGSARLPAVDGSQLTNLPGGGDLLSTNNLSDLTNFATARTNLGVAIGTDVQAYDAQLADIAGLTPTDSNFIVGNGTNFVTESGATARTSLGLTIGTDVQAYDAQLADIAGLTPTDSNFIVGNGTNFVTESGLTARTSLGCGSAATFEAGSNTANQLVQLDGSARLPAVDGSQLTNLPSGAQLPPEVKETTTSTPVTVSLTPSDSNSYNDIEVIYLVNNSSTAVELDLPTASGNEGKKINIKRNGTATVTIDPNGTEQIDNGGAGTAITLDAQYEAVTLVSNGTNWFII